MRYFLAKRQPSREELQIMMQKANPYQLNNDGTITELKYGVETKIETKAKAQPEQKAEHSAQVTEGTTGYAGVLTTAVTVGQVATK
jgi:hypothetical protein